MHLSMRTDTCRLLALEQEKQQLQKRLQDPAGPERPPLAELQSMRDDLARASREIQRLQEEADQARQRAVEAEEAAAARVAGLQRSLAAAEEARVAQASELAARPTVQALDDLRREVQSLQALQFGSIEMAAAGEGEDGGSGVLERAAAARVRALEHQITVCASRCASRHQYSGMLCLAHVGSICPHQCSTDHVVAQCLALDSLGARMRCRCWAHQSTANSS